MVTEIETGPQVPTNTNDNEGANGAFFFFFFFWSEGGKRQLVLMVRCGADSTTRAVMTPSFGSTGSDTFLLGPLESLLINQINLKVNYHSRMCDNHVSAPDSCL